MWKALGSGHRDDRKDWVVIGLIVVGCTLAVWLPIMIS